MTRAALAAVVAAVLAASGAAWAARLPDWARDIADAAPQLDEAVTKQVSRVLVYEKLVRVQPDGLLRTRLRLAKQALSVRADDEDVGLTLFQFREGAKIRRSRAWHVPPGERAEKNVGEFDAAVGDSFFTDDLARSVQVAGLKRGSLVFFEFESDEVPQTLDFVEFFRQSEPLGLGRLVVELPPGWSLRSAWLRGDGPAPQVSGATYTWQITDLPLIDDSDDLAPDADESCPGLALSLRPADGAASPPAFADWVALARWYQSLAANRDAASPEIVAAAKTIAQAAAGSPLAVARESYRFVRDRVRYVANDIGKGGYEPRAAESTMRDLYGDCKAKTTLLRTLLAANGISSYPLLVNSSLRRTVADDVPSVQSFNHVVLAIALPSEQVADVPALVDFGDVGRLLIADPTAPEHVFGAIPVELADRRGLLVAGERSRVVALPDAAAAWNRVERRIEARLNPDRTVAYTATTRYVGEPAAVARAAWRDSARETQESLQEDLRHEFVGASVSEAQVQEETADGALVETVSWTTAPLPPSGTQANVALFPGALDKLYRVPLAKRKTPVRYLYPRTLRTEIVLGGAPAQAVLPGPRNARGDGWSVETTFERDDAAVRGRFTLTLSRQEFAAEALGDLKKLYAAANNAADAVLYLSP
ncbi:MAG: DUF3857 domain-containing protein [Acidobacteria bacterium]|nr:DUF3857 domain-containing protein [Acidobacteriota bacterium]